jgi:hypothetical protein
MRSLLVAMALAIGSLTCACGGSTGSSSTQTGGTGGSGASGGSGATGGGGTSGACSGFVPKATADEVAKTPRSDEAAEVLAIETSNEFVASDALYQRIVGELAAIANAEPQVAGMGPFSVMSSNSIIIGLSATGFQSYQNGTYSAWDCPNEAYGMTQIQDVGSLQYVTIAFGQKRYNTPLLAQEYVGLPDVASAEPNMLVGDGPDVCLEIQGDVHFYIFDKAGGDCPAGCTEHTYYGFQVSAAGQVTSLGTFDPALPTPEPAWFTSLADCRTRL